jgi:hypothetical protein
MTTGIRAGASASENRIAFVTEAAWGTVPTSPSFKTMRMTSEDFKPGKQTTRSEEIDPSRNVKDEIMVGRNNDGSINFELSYGTYDDILESLMFASWSADTIKNGAGAGQSFTVERKINLPSGAFEYQRFNGMVANEFNLDATAGEIIKGSCSFMGKFGGRGSTALSGSTYANANTNLVMSAAAQFGTLNAVGMGSAAPRLRSLSLSVKNNLRSQNQLGQLDGIGIAPGICEVTGSFEAYFESGALFDAYLNHDDCALNFILGSQTLKKYKFWLPTLKLTGDPGIGTSGNNDDVMAKMNFTAIYDRLTSKAASIQIDRALS